MSSKGWRTWASRSAMLLLSLLFAVQVRVQVQKYLLKESTVTVRNEDEGSPPPLPAVSFCPGYKREPLEEAAFPLLQWNTDNLTTVNRLSSQGEEKYPKSREQMMQFWRVIKRAQSSITPYDINVVV